MAADEMAAPEICVTTRRAWKTQLAQAHTLPARQPHHPAYPPPSSPDSSPLTDTSELDCPSPSRETSASASSSSKRQRAPTLVDPPRVARPGKIKKRATTSTRTSRSSSRGESRQRSVALDEPIYRSDRSRSTSAFPPPAKVLAREWWSIEDGSPGDGFVSAADVVQRLVKTYKTCESPTRYGA